MARTPGKETNTAPTFGELVRQHRQRLHITMTALAKAAAIDQGDLSKIERGLRAPPQISSPTLTRIAAGLGFGPPSEQFQELLQAAYRERSGDPSAIAPYIPTLHLLIPKTANPVGGLGGLPAEMTHPDSPAGEYYRSQGIEVGQALGQQATAGTPLAATGALAQPPVAFGLAAVSMLNAAGIRFTYYEPDAGGFERVAMTLPDGQVVDVWMMKHP